MIFFFVKGKNKYEYLSQKILYDDDNSVKKLAKLLGVDES